MAGQNQNINFSTTDDPQKNLPQNTQDTQLNPSQDTQLNPSQNPQDTQLYPSHNVWANPQSTYTPSHEQYGQYNTQYQQQLNAYDNNQFYQPTGNMNYNNAYDHSYNPYQNQNFNTYNSNSTNPFDGDAYGNTGTNVNTYGNTGGNLNTYSAYSTGAGTNAYAPNAYSSVDNGTNTYNTANAYNTGPGTNAYSNTGGKEDTYNSSTITNSEPIENKEDNNVSVNLASAVNPGIETSDPSKLQPTEEQKKHIPSGKRFFFRLFILLASAGALGFIIGAPLISKRDPLGDANHYAIIFLYIVSGLSIIVSLYFLGNYCFRRWGKAQKMPRLSLHLLDFIFAASFGVLMVFLIKDYTCPIGGLNG
ncbi:1586_t:CDS:2, partial [Dentiscutata heterogama]